MALPSAALERRGASSQGDCQSYLMQPYTASVPRFPVMPRHCVHTGMQRLVITAHPCHGGPCCDGQLWARQTLELQTRYMPVRCRQSAVRKRLAVMVSSCAGLLHPATYLARAKRRIQ